MKMKANSSRDRILCRKLEQGCFREWEMENNETWKRLQRGVEIIFCSRLQTDKPN
jgi:hypothetical protein